MASIADTDSLSGIEPLDSTATSPLLTAAPIATHPDNLSPASQLSSLRTSLAQSSAQLKGGTNLESSLEESPELRLSNMSTLTQSSFGMHDVSHRSDAILQNQLHQDISRSREVRGKGVSSLPNTPYSNKQLQMEPQRLAATADHKHQTWQPDSQTHGSGMSGTRQDVLLNGHQTVHAHRQLFSNQTTKTGQRNPDLKSKATDLGRDPHPLNVSSRRTRDRSIHQGERSVPRPDRHPSSQTEPLRASLSRAYYSGDMRRPTTSLGGENWHLASQGTERRITDSYEKADHSSHRDGVEKQRAASSEKNFPEIQEMEQVRRSLYHMVHNSSRQPLERDSLESKGSIGELLASHNISTENGFPRDSLESARTESLLGPQSYQDISPLAMDSGLGLSSLWNLSNMPSMSFTSSRDGTLLAENQMLKDSVEKERYRRKHCEKQIGDVQAKLLETQQQLAVAISTDRKKDAMIEQLDKTLARIVDGWRKQEQDKNEALEKLTGEKQEMAEETEKLRKALDDHQAELDEAKERLSRELQQALQLQQESVCQLVSLQEEQSKVKDQLLSQQKLTAQEQHQKDSVVEERNRLDKQVKQVQHMLAEERQQSQTMRKEFEERIQQFEMEHQQLLEKQKAKLAEDARNSELLTANQQEVDKLKADLDAATRDKENVRLELSLQQAKFEATQQKQEADWQTKLEKRVDERLQELQLRSSHTESELRETHRKQLAELCEQHQSQLLSQRAAHSEDLAQRDQKIRELTQQYQSRLEQHHQDMSQMTQRLERAQQQRSVLVQRLQGVQVYCTDVLSEMTHASPLIKKLSSGMEAAIGGGPIPSAPFTIDQSEKTQGTRPPGSPITITVSSPRRGVGVGAGVIEKRQEHDDGDGQEDDTFFVPDLSLATSMSQSPCSHDLFRFHTNTSFQSKQLGNAVLDQDVAPPLSLPSQILNLPAVRDSRADGFAFPSHEQVQISGGKDQGNAVTTSKVPNMKEQPAMGISQGKQPLTQHLQYYSSSGPVLTPATGVEVMKEPHRNPSINVLPNLSEYAINSSQEKHRAAQGLQYISGLRPDAAPAEAPEQRKDLSPDKLHFSTEGLPSQDLISEGLRMLKMSPPSGHSSPLQDPARGTVGLTLGDILRTTGGKWDGLKEGMGRNGEEEFREFREIQPSFDDTKTTNSVAAYPSEDETVSELESGQIHPDSSHILLERLAEHKQRQMALQHYIQLLLQHPPGAPVEEPSSHHAVVTKETVSIAKQKQGMTTWHELAPQRNDQEPVGNAPGTKNTHTNPRTNQVTTAQGPAHQGPTRAERRPKTTGVSGGGGLRQTADKQASSTKPKGPTVTQNQVPRNTRQVQKTTAAAAKPIRQVAASSTTAHKKVVRKGATRN